MPVWGPAQICDRSDPTVRARWATGSPSTIKQKTKLVPRPGEGRDSRWRATDDRPVGALGGVIAPQRTARG